VAVNLYNVDSDLRIVGVQFRLLYNDTLLEALDAYEGPFMRQFNNTVDPPYTQFMKFIEDDPKYGPNVLIGILLLPNATGHWTNFPEGDGTLATITFKAIYQPPEGISLRCSLQLNDTIIVNDSLEDVPHKCISGEYEIKGLTFDYTPVTPLPGQIVSFTLTQPENHVPIIYNWNFRDGVIKNTTESFVTHIFNLPKNYTVTLTCLIEGASASVSKILAVEGPLPLPLDIRINVGELYFPEETVTFNLLITYYGKRIDPDTMSALLYFITAASYMQT